MTILFVIATVSVLLGAVGLWRGRWMPLETLIVTFVVGLHALAALAVSATGGIEILSGSATAFVITQQETEEAGLLLLRGAAFMVVFSLILAPFVRSALGAVGGDNERLSVREAVLKVLPQRAAHRISLGAFAFAALMWLVNWRELWVRDSYQFLDPGSIVAALSFLVLPVGIAAIMCIYVATGYTRLIAILAFVGLCAASIATGSRSFAVLATSIVAIGALFARRLASRALLIFASAIVALWSLSLMIQLRGVPGQQGLSGYLDYILSGQYSLTPAQVEAVVNNLLLSIPVTLASARLPTPPGMLEISFNPLPGELVGWYEISPYLSLGYQTPSNAIGQLLAGDLVYQLLGWATLSVILIIPALLRRPLGPTLGVIAGSASALMVLGATLQFLQYSLRSGMRFVWAAVAISAIAWIVQIYINSAANQRVRSKSARRPADPAAAHRDSRGAVAPSAKLERE
ncbi:hypothetical protein BH10ACT5_BH10ACT5_08880 [soil metagenome]